MTKQQRITLVGCGKMGSALLESWLDAFPEYSFGVIEPNAIEPALNEKITHATKADDLSDFITRSDIIIMAVKPQIMSDVCATLSPLTKPECLILSIAAGQSLASFTSYFDAAQPVIRAMPNIPAAINKGMSVAVANTHASNEQKQSAHALLQSTGHTEWIENEALLDAVTAVSGSGPAYVFYLIESLEKAAHSAGLPAALAKTLARQTVIGAAALAENQPDIDASVLRENVTSPGGTTAAALKILMNGEMDSLFIKAIAAAKKRSEELS